MSVNSFNKDIIITAVTRFKLRHPNESTKDKNAIADVERAVDLPEQDFFDYVERQSKDKKLGVPFRQCLRDALEDVRMTQEFDKAASESLTVHLRKWHLPLDKIPGLNLSDLRLSQVLDYFNLKVDDIDLSVAPYFLFLFYSLMFTRKTGLTGFTFIDHVIQAQPLVGHLIDLGLFAKGFCDIVYAKNQNVERVLGAASSYQWSLRLRPFSGNPSEIRVNEIDYLNQRGKLDPLPFFDRTDVALDDMSDGDLRARLSAALVDAKASHGKESRLSNTSAFYAYYDYLAYGLVFSAWMWAMMGGYDQYVGLGFYVSFLVKYYALDSVRNMLVNSLDWGARPIQDPGLRSSNAALAPDKVTAKDPDVDKPSRSKRKQKSDTKQPVEDAGDVSVSEAAPRSPSENTKITSDEGARLAEILRPFNARLVQQDRDMLDGKIGSFKEALAKIPPDAKDKQGKIEQALMRHIFGKSKKNIHALGYVMNALIKDPGLSKHQHPWMDSLLGKTMPGTLQMIVDIGKQYAVKLAKHITNKFSCPVDAKVELLELMLHPAYFIHRASENLSQTLDTKRPTQTSKDITALKEQLEMADEIHTDDSDDDLSSQAKRSAYSF